MCAKQSAYYEIDGQKLIRVTSVLGQTLAKPALVNWASKATREGAVAYLEGRREAKVDEALIQGTLEAAKSGTNTEVAIRRGVDFHEAAMLYMGGDPWPNVPGMKALQQWYIDVQPKPVALENVVYSRALGCAGTFDGLMDIGGLRTIIDYKTGGVYQEAAIQLSAYAGLWESMNPGRPIDACQVIQIDTATETYKVHQVDDWRPIWENAFLPLLQTWKQLRGDHLDVVLSGWKAGRTGPGVHAAPVPTPSGENVLPVPPAAVAVNVLGSTPALITASSASSSLITCI